MSLITTYVRDHQSLVKLCEKLAKSPLLTIDTEFVRTRTLYPKLGLLQICNGEYSALIDPVTIDDLSSFWALLTDGGICKVLHACSEDLEVFLTAANCKPINLIDSQIMMGFLGHGISLGYAGMVEHFTGISLDKSESRTDWTKRPLTQNQMTYAHADVDYLFQIYPQLLAEITTAGWLEAARQETQLLIEKKFTAIDENNLFRNIKMCWRLNPEQLNHLKYLTAWRFQRAQQRDLPLGFVVKDHTMFAVAAHNPDSLSAMAKLEGVESLDVKHQGKAMLVVLKQSNTVESADYPEKIVRLDEYPNYKQIFKAAKGFVATVATTSGLGPEILGSKKQINQFLSWYFKIDASHPISKDNVDILKNWRLTLFGEAFIAFANNDFK